MHYFNPKVPGVWPNHILVYILWPLQAVGKTRVWIPLFYGLTASERSLVDPLFWAVLSIALFYSYWKQCCIDAFKILQELHSIFYSEWKYYTKCLRNITRVDPCFQVVLCCTERLWYMVGADLLRPRGWCCPKRIQNMSGASLLRQEK